MKILIADSDRDLLISYKKLLELDSNDVIAVFDGAQAIMQLANNKFDIVILNRNIPRVDSKQIIKMLNDDNIPVIVLSDKKITSGVLLDNILANSYLSFPFLPYELSDRMKDVISKISSKDKICFDSIEIDVKHFKSSDGTRFTNEEINILQALSKGKQFEVRQVHSYINSLNNKFERLNKKYRVKYVINEGYRLVTENE